MNRNERNCEQFRSLLNEQNSGDVLGSEQHEFLDEHRRSCSDCQFESTLSHFVSDIDAEGPASLLEDQDQWANDVLDRLNQENHDRKEGPSQGRFSKRLIIASVLAAAASVLIALSLIALFRDQPPDRQDPSIFWAAGSVLNDNETIQAGSSLQIGSTIKVGAGQAGLRFCGEVDLFLDRGTQVRIAGDDRRAQKCQVDMDHGTIVVDADRLDSGTKFRVKTGSSVIDVTGTVFAVEVNEQNFEVRVVHGEVVHTDPSGRSKKIRQTQVYRSGDESVRDVDPERAEADRAFSQWFRTKTGQNLAFISIVTEPPGQIVVLGGRSLGPTPVTALVSSGAHMLEISSQNFAPLREHLRLEGGSKTSRHYVLVAEDNEAQGQNGREVSVQGEVSEPSSDDRPPEPQSSNNRASNSLLRPAQLPTETHTERPAEPTAAELFAKARELRIQRDWAATARLYQKILSTYPSSPQARASLIPLGQIRLERLGDPEGALRVFNRYASISSSGPLAEEAAWGRARALRRLGRRSQEIRALRDFLAAHPTSLRARRARDRLAELDRE